MRQSMVLVAVVVIAGCRGERAAPSFPTIAVTSTAYVTVPARTTTSTIAVIDDGAADGGGGDAPQVEPVDDPTRERIYEIQSGDFLVGIARDFDVPVDNLVLYNGWGDGLRHALVPGDEIRIPPSDYDPGATSPDGSGDSAAAGESIAGDSSGACPEGQAQGTYTIRPGDIPARVAQANATTVAELDAANVGVAGYPGFVVGITINLPC